LPTAKGLPINLLFRFVAAPADEVLAIGWHDMPELTRLQQQLIELNSELSHYTRAAFKDYCFEVDRNEEDHRRILEAAGEGIFGLDAEGRHTVVNPAAAAMLGYSQAELIGKSSHALWHSQHPDGQPFPEAESPIQQTLVQGIAYTNDSDYFQRKDGSFFPVTFTSRPIIDHRRVVGAVVTFVDISERKQAEQEIKRVNADLQRFAEVTAHHMQEPARRMATYAERLTKQLGDRIDDAESRLSLEFIGTQARRLQDLLRDVERYLSAERPRGEIKATDANKVVSALLARMSESISATRAEISVGDLPPARIDMLRLRDLFELVLENALQHGRSDQSLLVAIDGERNGQHVRYRISDNGPGIEKAYRDRVFRVFEHLASGREGTSTGIGLAIVRRIAESCGGRAWIEEAPSGGCCVLFELPAAEPT
jgi:PAS domain S-box-containing protein